jgi:hypothetical protein
VTGSSTAVADEAGIRASIGTVGVDFTQTFTTWDKFPAVAARYTRTGGTDDLKTYTNALARALVPNSTGALSNTAGVTGDFKLQAQYVHRSNNSVVVVLALSSAATYDEAGSLFTMSDTAGGTALAQFGDADAVQCETFTASTAAVDFLFVVDDSGSMATSQQSLSNAATAMANKLANTTLDWRLGMVTTSYTSTLASDLSKNSNINKGAFRTFTKNVDQFRAWLTQNSACSSGTCSSYTSTTTCVDNRQCWVNITGDGTERPYDAARAAVNYITGSATGEDRLRAGAKLVVIVMTDTHDQSTDTIGTYINFFNDPNGNPAKQRIAVHGIICPQGQTCGSNEEPNSDSRLTDVINATGGLSGYIKDPANPNTNTIDPTINAIVDSVIASSGYKTLKPPIGASMRVAMANVLDPVACPTKSDLPRSRTNGFDVDGINQTVSFYGGCRPAAAGTTQAAVSYRYWVDRTSNPDGSPPPCSGDANYDPNQADFCKGKLTCNRTTDLCECPSDCGGGGQPGQVCNTDPNVCAWQCAPDCGGTCGAFKTCNTSTCACTCTQSATCAPGFKFDATACGCVCDAAALNCGSTYNVDLNTCSCFCKTDCGGCPPGFTCNTSYCVCQGGIN